MRRGSDSGSDSGSDTPAVRKPAAPGGAAKAPSQWADDSDSFGGDSSDTSSSASEADAQWEDVAARRKRWLLKPGAGDESAWAWRAACVRADGGAEPKPAAKPAKPAPDAPATPAPEAAAGAEGAAAGAAAAPPKEKEIEWTDDLVRKKLREAVALRGRKGADRSQLLDTLRLLLSKAVAAQLRIEVLVQLAAMQLDSTPALATHMSSALWRACHDLVADALALLADSPDAVRELLAAPAALVISDVRTRAAWGRAGGG
jgi:hypothetical protein